MSAYDYDSLKNHVGHTIVVVAYADGENVACECETCSEVILDYDRPESKPKLKAEPWNNGGKATAVRKH